MGFRSGVDGGQVISLLTENSSLARKCCTSGSMWRGAIFHKYSVLLKNSSSNMQKFSLLSFTPLPLLNVPVTPLLTIPAQVMVPLPPYCCTSLARASLSHKTHPCGTSTVTLYSSVRTTLLKCSLTHFKWFWMCALLRGGGGSADRHPDFIQCSKDSVSFVMFHTCLVEDFWASQHMLNKNSLKSPQKQRYLKPWNSSSPFNNTCFFCLKEYFIPNQEKQNYPLLFCGTKKNILNNVCSIQFHLYSPSSPYIIFVQQ